MNKKNLLITGSNGFIGLNLINRIRSSYNIFEFNIDHGDIATAELHFSDINHVIHLAGQTFVPKSWEDPYIFYRTNLLGTINILDFCRKNNISLTYISAYVYGIPEYLPIDENHPTQAANPYMHSKIEAEEICKFYAKNFGVKMTILRPFNIYGPGQSESFIIPKIIKQVLSESENIEVFSLLPKRDYLFIDDLTQAIMLAIEKDGNFNIFNIGSGVSYSVQEIINMVMEITQIKKNIFSTEQERKNEIPDVISDVSLVKEKLGWIPKTDIYTGLKKTIEELKNDL